MFLRILLCSIDSGHNRKVVPWVAEEVLSVEYCKTDVKSKQNYLAFYCYCLLDFKMFFVI